MDADFSELPERDNADIEIYTADSRDANLHANFVGSFHYLVLNPEPLTELLTPEAAALKIVADLHTLIVEAKENLIHIRSFGNSLEPISDINAMVEAEIEQVFGVDPKLGAWKSMVEFMRARLIARHYIQDSDQHQDTWWMESNCTIGDVMQSLDAEIYQFCTNNLPMLAFENVSGPTIHSYLIQVYQTWMQIMALYLRLQGKQMPLKWKHMVILES
jgi:hypothetical protein